MTKQEYAQQIAEQLLATERMMNKAAAEASKLLVTLVEAQAAVDAHDVETQEIISSVGQAVAGMTNARSSVILAHKTLKELEERHGVNTTVMPLCIARLNSDASTQRLRVVR
jgi:hypothetical protein